MDLDILVYAGDDIVSPFGNGERRAGDEAKVARGSCGAVERGDNVLGDVGDGLGCGVGMEEGTVGDMREGVRGDGDGGWEGEGARVAGGRIVALRDEGGLVGDVEEFVVGHGGDMLFR